MNTISDLPKGIRLHNPGNLRTALTWYGGVTQFDGGVAFTTAANGLIALAHQVYLTYRSHGCLTPIAFASRWSGAAGQELVNYARVLAATLGMAPTLIHASDMDLLDPWNALAVMSGVVIAENGHPPSEWAGGPRWYTIGEYCSAIQRTALWPSEVVSS